jgi:hypothetical protein
VIGKPEARSQRSQKKKTGRLLIWLLASGFWLSIPACGKVGDPLPPLIRIPEPVKDLTVSQHGYELVLTWTNPQRYIDGSAATDLARVNILSNGALAASLNIAGSGQQQSHAIPVRAAIGVQHNIAVEIQTAREKRSALSNMVSATPVEVPGPVVSLRMLVDQRRITIEWQAPSENGHLADAYLVSRADRTDTDTVKDRQFQDADYEQGSTYTYRVTAARRVSGTIIPGIPGSPFTVRAIDKTAPRVPRDLQIVSSDSGGFLTWEANAESDLAGYRIFRSASLDGPFTEVREGLHPTHGIFDPGYQPGLYYAVSAVDDFGNESMRSTPYREP